MNLNKNAYPYFRALYLRETEKRERETDREREREKRRD